MPAVDKFVARLNIEHFQRKLADESDKAKRRLLETLLAEEKAKLIALDNEPEDRVQSG